MNRIAGSPHVFRVAIVGAATLKGRELKEVLDEMNFPVADMKLLDDDDYEVVEEAAVAIEKIEGK